jgi:hypothetical protein
MALLIFYFPSTELVRQAGATGPSGGGCETLPGLDTGGTHGLK